ncbi:hypothetical protein RCG24_05410 [Neobacillus sp. OS1-32]|uniref:hypothetical protein n=1 Tax=Neobacillus sp. OS1-32 TaxID=3070682 RepID=UPI0027E053A3|nr:hypothetical protein [Neobacillus sp. OS1-32]WML31312.1 hypothetical protein RCG24_05410 [Neobacillus sp. OS1-32]
MSDHKKEKVKTWLLVIMIISLVGAFTLFFLGHYKIALGLAGVFMALASFLSQWTQTKNAEYVYRKSYKNRW